MQAYYHWNLFLEEFATYRYRVETADARTLVERAGFQYAYVDRGERKAATAIAKQKEQQQQQQQQQQHNHNHDQQATPSQQQHHSHHRQRQQQQRKPSGRDSDDDGDNDDDEEEEEEATRFASGRGERRRTLRTDPHNSNHNKEPAGAVENNHRVHAVGSPAFFRAHDAAQWRKIEEMAQRYGYAFRRDDSSECVLL